MPRLNTVKSARKEHKCGRCGKAITIGDSYFWWRTKTGPASGFKSVRCSEHQPRPSEITSNQYQSMILAALEGWDDGIGQATTVEEVVDLAREVAEVATDIADTMEQNADSIEDGFGHATYQSDELRERSEMWRSYADEIESATSDADMLDAECGECGLTESDHDETDECAECGLSEGDHVFDEDDDAHEFEAASADHDFEADPAEAIEVLDEALGNTPE